MAERKSKNDLINAISAETGLSKTNAAEALEATISTIQNWTANGIETVLVGFGSFGQSKSAERMGRNPQTGKEIRIPAATKPKFKPGKAFKDAVNKTETV